MTKVVDVREVVMSRHDFWPLQVNVPIRRKTAGSLGSKISIIRRETDLHIILFASVGGIRACRGGVININGTAGGQRGRGRVISIIFAHSCHYQSVTLVCRIIHIFRLVGEMLQETTHLRRNGVLPDPALATESSNSAAIGAVHGLSAQNASAIEECFRVLRAKTAFFSRLSIQNVAEAFPQHHGGKGSVRRSPRQARLQPFPRP
jgi:hypothetical protein